MHRSGTSALTGALRESGVWLGSSSDLTGASEQNPRGFFERRDVRAVCDSLLHAAGGDWWKIARLRLDTIPQSELIESGKLFEDVVAKLQRKGSVWAIKEPRLCLLFPILQPYIPQPVCILIHRNPLEVAQSLRSRNGFGLAEGLALWEAYNLSALRASKGFPRVLISYEDLLSDPYGVMERLFQKLSHKFGVDLAALSQEAIKNFISPKLRHQKNDVQDAEAFFTRSQRRLWLQLRSGEALEMDKIHGAPYPGFETLMDLEARVETLKYVEDLKRCKGKLPRRRNQFSQPKNQLVEQDRTIEKQEKLLKEKDIQLARIQSSMSWRVTAPLRWFVHFIRQAIKRVSRHSPSENRANN
jgi:hypothetical protein